MRPEQTVKLILGHIKAGRSTLLIAREFGIKPAYVRKLARNAGIKSPSIVPPPIKTAPQIISKPKAANDRKIFYTRPSELVRILLSEGEMLNSEIATHCGVSRQYVTFIANGGNLSPPRSKLAKAIIERIKEGKLTQREIAEEFGVGQPYVSRLAR